MDARMTCFFFIGSTYSYLAVSRAQALTAAAGVDLAWTPFSVRTLMHEQGNVPFAGKPAKLAYMWRDLARRAGRFGIPFAGPPPYPIDADERANRVATLAAAEGWCLPFAQAAYRCWFVDGRDPGLADNLAAILRGLGRAPGPILERADSAAVRQRYDAATARARALGIFGAPTFVVGDELFWGDDRLDDAVAWCRGGG